MKQRLYTIGYEGLAIAGYIRKLRDAGVGVVADVRAMPSSRKPGFSKGTLSAKLERHGIRYVHLPSAGNPFRDSDDPMRDYRRFVKKDPTGVKDIEKLVKTAAKQKETVCLTCYEGPAEYCHRSVLAAALSKRIPIRVIDL